MLEPYLVFIEERAAQTILSLPSGERSAVMGTIRSLAADPFQEGDFLESDSTGRDTYCLLVADYALSFYPDHAVKELKFFQFTRADQ